MALSALRTHAGNAGSRPLLRQGAHLDFFGQRVRRDCLGRRLLDQARRKHGTNRAGGILDLRIPSLSRSTRATLLREEFRCDRELRCISLLWNRRLVFGVHIVVLKARRPIGYRRPGHSGGAFRSTTTHTFTQYWVWPGFLRTHPDDSRLQEVIGDIYSLALKLPRAESRSPGGA